MKNFRFRIPWLILQKVADLLVLPKRDQLWSFPDQIGNYHFVGETKLTQRACGFRFAFYEDRAGNLSLAKSWTLCRHDFDFYSLWNELTVYHSLHRIAVRHAVPLARLAPDVRIPRLLGESEIDDAPVILLELVDGETLTNDTPQEKTNAVLRVIGFFHGLSAMAQEEDLADLTTRSAISHICLFPAFLIISLLRHPKLIGQLAHAAGFFFSAAPALLADGRKTLVHRDLQDANILKRGERLCPIDFQEMVLSHPLLEVACVLLNSWNDRAFIAEFMRAPGVREAVSTATQKRILKAFSLYIAVQTLAHGQGDDAHRARQFMRALLSSSFM